MEIQNFAYDERGLPIWFLIGSNSLFLPLLGDEERTIINWLEDLKNEYNFHPVLITSFPEIEGFDNDIPFETIRLSPKVEYNRNLLIYLNNVRNSKIDTNHLIPTLKNRFDIDLDDSSQWEDIIKLVKDRNPFNYFLAIDDWADEELTPLVKKTLIAEKIPHYIEDIITIRVSHETYGSEEKDTNCDLFLHSCPYEYIRNKNANTFYDGIEDNKYRLFLYPKPSILDLNHKLIQDQTGWKLRPYDYIYYYPSIDKGSPIVFNLALNYPNKRFLVLEADDLKPKSYKDYGIWVEEMKKLDNVDIVDKVVDFNNDFLRKGKFLLYPSILDSIGWLPLEAGMQGAIPICSDTGILRHSAGPFSEFVYNEIITFNPNDIIMDKIELHDFNFLDITKSWLDKINFLDNNPVYVALLFDNLKHIPPYLTKRYELQRTRFRTLMYELNRNWVGISDNL